MNVDHRQVVGVDVVARVDFGGRLTDDLTILKDRPANFHRANGNFVPRGDLLPGREPLPRPLQGRAGGYVGSGHGNVVGLIQKDECWRNDFISHGRYSIMSS